LLLLKTVFIVIFFTHYPGELSRGLLWLPETHLNVIRNLRIWYGGFILFSSKIAIFPDVGSVSITVQEIFASLYFVTIWATQGLTRMGLTAIVDNDPGARAVYFRSFQQPNPATAPYWADMERPSY
jgi:hypothetical protein